MTISRDCDFARLHRHCLLRHIQYRGQARSAWQVLSSIGYWDANAILLLSVDYSVFAIPDFDPNEYANAVLAGESYPASSLEVPTDPGSRKQGHGSTLAPIQPQAGKKRVGVDIVSILEPAREDISVAISKLDLGIEDVNKQIKALVRYTGFSSDLC